LVEHFFDGRYVPLLDQPELDFEVNIIQQLGQLLNSGLPPSDDIFAIVVAVHTCPPRLAQKKRGVQGR
jgi:hypothetical protein